MHDIRSMVAALGLCLVTAACAANTSQQVMNKEDMLAASGFKFVPANTPQRQASFRQFPPHKFTRQVRNDKVIYAYADPTICVCLYVGGQKAYDAYRARAYNKQIADEQLTVANDMSDMNNFDWGPWGDGYPYGWPYIDSIYNY